VDRIQVPAPPRSAYNPNRRVSDLILGQLKHFQHVEQKHGKLGIDPALARDIYTESGAARYITAITRALRRSGAVQPSAIPQPGTAIPASNIAVLPASKAAKQPHQTGIAIAASAEESPAKKAVVKKLAKSTKRKK
jgi:hypothetical protein